MSNTTANLRRKIRGAVELQSVVRTMKAVAASNIGAYRTSVHALADYHRCLELGIAVCLRESTIPELMAERKKRVSQVSFGAVVFGSDQGLVGRFNDAVVDATVKTVADRSAKPDIWSVGERVFECLTAAGLQPKGHFPVPVSVATISPLVSQLLLETETRFSSGEITELHLFYNHTTTGTEYRARSQKLLPLDEQWQRELAGRSWPRKTLPEVIDGSAATLPPFISEYLFVSLFRACAESLASENISRLAAMQRADKNIGELLEQLTRTFHRLRQGSIDEELFDVIAGFEALGVQEHGSHDK